MVTWDDLRNAKGIQLVDFDTVSEKADELHMFLAAFFGRKRLLVLRVQNNHRKILKELKNYCTDKNLELCRLDEKKLSEDYIKGEVEINYVDSSPESWGRKRPSYIRDVKQMIIVEDLNETTDTEILRAFMYMGRLGTYYNDLENLPKDKLPYGSGYVFLADEDFPLQRFASISSYWNEEAAVIDLRDFQSKVKEHMGNYKDKVLGIPEDGVYRYQKQEIPQKHILPKNKEEFNIDGNYRADFYASQYKKGITFHKYFHHLNSSQAMCINFFYPLIKEKRLETILDILGIPGETIYSPDCMCFEKESEVEKSAKRKTNFDFFMRLNPSINVYFEIKYTENEFGKAKFDDEHDEHKKKFRKTYLPLLNNNPAIKEEFKEEDTFLKNYQIMRNLVHIDKDSYVVFLFPTENNAIREAAMSAKKQIIEEDWQNHFKPTTWEYLVEQVCLRLNSQNLTDYYSNEFSKKYLQY